MEDVFGPTCSRVRWRNERGDSGNGKRTEGRDYAKNESFCEISPNQHTVCILSIFVPDFVTKRHQFPLRNEGPSKQRHENDCSLEGSTSSNKAATILTMPAQKRESYTYTGAAKQQLHVQGVRKVGLHFSAVARWRVFKCVEKNERKRLRFPCRFKFPAIF